MKNNSAVMIAEESHHATMKIEIANHCKTTITTIMRKVIEIHRMFMKNNSAVMIAEEPHQTTMIFEITRLSTLIAEMFPHEITAEKIRTIEIH
jgi:hypothetical protein